MMEVRYCDICHDVISRYKPTLMLKRFTVENIVEQGESVILCDRCAELFDDWVDGRANIIEDGE